MRRVLAVTSAVLALQLVAHPASANAGAAAIDTIAISLEESVRRALAHNKDLMVTREKVSEARARVSEAGTAFLPQLTGNAGYTRLDVAPFLPTSRFAIFGGSTMPGVTLPKEITIGLTDNYSTSLKLQQPLFTGGTIRKTYEISRLAQHAAESELDQTTSEIIFEVKRAYLSCAKADKLEKVAEQSVMQLGAHLKDLQAMYDAGLAATNDVLKTKVYHSESKLALMKAQHAVRLARKNFCDIVDLPLTSEIIFTSHADTVAPIGIDLDAAVTAGIGKRAELKSLEADARITQKEIELNRNGYLPNVYFFANLGYNYPDREFARDFYSTWSMGVLAQVNVFDWGRTAYKTQQSKSRLKQIELTEQSVTKGITLDITRTYLTLVDAWNEIDVARENVAQAEENFRVTNEKFKEGLATNTEILDAEVLLTNARTTYGNAMIDYLIAQADLARAVGSTEE